MIVGILYERRHTREIAEYGGISNVMPLYATITMIMFLSSMGLPLLNGFVGEFTILQGTFMENWRWGAWAVPGVVLAAAYLLWLYQRVFFGTVTNPKNEKLHDLTPREVATFVPLLIMAFWIGLYPKPFFQILEQPVNHTIAVVRPDYPQPAVNAAAQPSALATATAGMPSTTNPPSAGRKGDELVVWTDYLLALPITLLALFALGILLIDFMLPQEMKWANAVTAFIGVMFSAAGVYKIQLWLGSSPGSFGPDADRADGPFRDLFFLSLPRGNRHRDSDVGTVSGDRARKSWRILCTDAPLGCGNDVHGRRNRYRSHFYRLGIDGHFDLRASGIPAARPAVE